MALLSAMGFASAPLLEGGYRGGLLWLAPAAVIGYVYGWREGATWRAGLPGLTVVPLTSVLALDPLPAIAVFAATCLGVAHRDIALNVRMKRRIIELAAAQASLEAQQISQRERATLARELHDIVGHHVTAVVVLTEAVQARAEDGLPELARVADSARAALRELDTLVVGLRECDTGATVAPTPSLSGIRNLLRPLIDLGVRVNIHLESDDLSQHLQLTAYRIVQECVTNTLKHANAYQVSVWVMQDYDNLMIEYQDDGQGFDPGVAGDGHGLLGIHERVSAHGGTARVDSSLNSGTHVSVRLPVAPPRWWIPS